MTFQVGDFVRIDKDVAWHGREIGQVKRPRGHSQPDRVLVRPLRSTAMIWLLQTQLRRVAKARCLCGFRGWTDELESNNESWSCPSCGGDESGLQIGGDWP